MFSSCQQHHITLLHVQCSDKLWLLLLTKEFGKQGLQASIRSADNFHDFLEKSKGMFSVVLPSPDLKHYMLRLWLSAIKNCSPTSLCLYHTLPLTLPKASEEFLSHLVKLGFCRLLQWPQVFICKIPLEKEQEKTQQRSAWKTWLGTKSTD